MLASRPPTTAAAAASAATPAMKMVAWLPAEVVSAVLPATYTLGSTANTLVCPAESLSVKPSACKQAEGGGTSEAGTAGT